MAFGGPRSSCVRPGAHSALRQDSRNDLTPCRMPLHFVSAGARAPHSDETPGPTATGGRRTPLVAYTPSLSCAPPLNDYHHPATEGLGPINTKQDQATGLIMHDTVAFSEDGIPLSVIDAQCWARNPHDLGKRERRQHLPIEQKESHKWLYSYRKLAEIQALCPDTLFVSVGGRELDLYELFTEAAREPTGPKLLVRAERSRRFRVDTDVALWSYVSAQPVAGEFKLQLPKRGNRPAREVLLRVRFCEVELQAPNHSSHPPFACGRSTYTKARPRTVASRSNGSC